MDKLKIFLKNLVISFLFCMLLLYIFSCLLTYTNIKDTMLGIFVNIAVIFSSILGSFFTCRKIKEKGIMYGGIFGLLYITIIYALHSICFLEMAWNINVLTYYITSILSGIIGGILGVNM